MTDTREAVARAICREDGCVEDCSCPMWPDYGYRADAAIAAHLKALAAEGMVVVPREPTEAMLENGVNADEVTGDWTTSFRENTRLIYRAMIQEVDNG